MNQSKEISVLVTANKKTWTKPKCISGKDFNYFGMPMVTGPTSGSPS